MASTLATVAIALVVLVITSVLVYLNNVTERKVLIKDKLQEFPLIQKTVVSSNSAVYRFGLPRSIDVLGLPIGQHITITANINGKDISRSYTPTSSDTDKGYFDILIKSYAEGNISKYVAELKIGDKIKVKGPKGFFEYTPNMVTHFGMVAGGTGIAPMYQIIKAIASNPEDKTEVQLIYGNQTEADILLKPELDQIAKEHANIKIHYILDKAPIAWDGGEGYITQDVLNSFLPASTPSTKVLVCGPPGLISSVKKSVVNLGFQKAKPVSKLPDQVFVF